MSQASQQVEAHSSFTIAYHWGSSQAAFDLHGPERITAKFVPFSIETYQVTMRFLGDGAARQWKLGYTLKCLLESHVRQAS